jgi:hypothetical protein
MWEFQMALIAVKWEPCGILGGTNLDRLDFFNWFVSSQSCCV